MTNETTEATRIHPFEAAGLGIAPFKFVGMDRKVGPIDLGGGMFAGAPGQPMGTCDYCGNGIADCCNIKSADGKFFVVGTTCVEKTTSKGARLLTEVQQAVKAARKVATDARNAAKIEAARAGLEIEAVREYLASKESPNAYRASKGDTLLDWAVWMMRSAGTTGRLEVARVVAAVQEKISKVAA